MSALLLKLQTEREKREALEHEVDIIKRRLEERSVVQSVADYKQTRINRKDRHRRHRAIRTIDGELTLCVGK